jgi:hypothetical protein
MELDPKEIRGLSRVLQDALRHPGVNRPTVASVSGDTTVIPDTAVGAFRVEQFDFDSFTSAVDRVLKRLPTKPVSAQVAAAQTTPIVAKPVVVQVADRRMSPRRRRGR